MTSWKAKRSPRLQARDEDLIQLVAEANPRIVVVVVITGSAVVMEAWRSRVPAILMAWYPGMEGGHAIADVLTGAAEPGGRRPMATPTDGGHLPFFDPCARRITYDRWWGQRKLDRDRHQAAYPLGFGPGYTTFALTGLQVTRTAPVAADGSGGVLASVTVTNAGTRAGSTVIQLYAATSRASPHRRPARQLLGFTQVQLPAGATARAQVHGSLRPLARPGDPHLVARPRQLPAGSGATQRRPTGRRRRSSADNRLSRSTSPERGPDRGVSLPSSPPVGGARRVRARGSPQQGPGHGGAQPGTAPPGGGQVCLAGRAVRQTPARRSMTAGTRP